jgi:predicted naringenin-chalcone synthase
MHILGIGTATPPHRYTQPECFAALQASPQFPELTPRARAILETVLQGNNGITSRCLALDSLKEAFELDPDTLHRRFARHAPTLAAEAAWRALRDAGEKADAIEAVIISTCTGYLCPGLTSYVTESLGLRRDVFALDLVGQGCGAALPNLRMAEALLAVDRCRSVLSICVEVCSAAFYLDNDPGVLISACLFGDGAGAAVLGNRPHPTNRPIRWTASGSTLAPGDRDVLRFEQCQGMLRNVLKLSVPQLAATQAEIVLDDVVTKSGVSRSDIRTWIWHAGGRDVLDAVQERIKLSANDLQWSRAVLNEYGNLSSAFVYFVLQKAVSGRAPSGHWWLSSFGAGFSCHGALLEVA